MPKRSFHAISAMLQYETKSFEDLCLEYYFSGKHTLQQVNAPASAFGCAQAGKANVSTFLLFQMFCLGDCFSANR